MSFILSIHTCRVQSEYVGTVIMDMDMYMDIGDAWWMVHSTLLYGCASSRSVAVPTYM